MKSRFRAVYRRLFKYSALLGILGGIASLIGPPNHGGIKTAIGMVVGAMLLGHKLPNAFKEFFSLVYNHYDEIFKE